MHLKASVNSCVKFFFCVYEAVNVSFLEKFDNSNKMKPIQNETFIYMYMSQAKFSTLNMIPVRGTLCWLCAFLFSYDSASVRGYLGVLLLNYVSTRQLFTSLRLAIGDTLHTHTLMLL